MKTIFVSGASRGIGAAIAHLLAKKGDCRLILTCKSNLPLLKEQTAAWQAAYDCKIEPYACDCADYKRMSELSNHVLSRYEVVDTVINNAGIAHIGLLNDLSTDDWHRIIDTNLSSCFYTAKAFTPAMIKYKKGQIINISSMWGNVGASCEVAYSASKGGMNAFTKALAKELAPSGISVNAISCGVIDTDMNASLTEEDLRALRKEIPADRLGTPEDVAQTVLALLQMPSYVTGQIIGCDGGI